MFINKHEKYSVGFLLFRTGRVKETVISLFLYFCSLKHSGCSEKIHDRFSFPLFFSFPFLSFEVRCKVLRVFFLMLNCIIHVTYSSSDLSEVFSSQHIPLFAHFSRQFYIYSPRMK